MTPGIRGVTPAFWRDKRVLLTGHTGFKGAWAALTLHAMGAKVSGLALPPETEPSLYDLAGVSGVVPGGIADLRVAGAVRSAVEACDPQIVLHMAAQALVRRSVREPVLTFDVNVGGAVTLLEALRGQKSLAAVLVITTDKVYENHETGRAFAENDPLGGREPYSASKAAAEMVASSYARTYFEPAGVPVATARGGNVIGGGDFSEDRIVPDIWRASQRGVPVRLRYPDAIRPWQHVLDCISGYLAYAQKLAQGGTKVRALNIGPGAGDPLTVADLTRAIQEAIGARDGFLVDDAPKTAEMSTLTLETSLARDVLGWHDRLAGRDAIAATADWYKALAQRKDMRAFTLRQIEEHFLP
ncbi:MAG: CDP-glucose 4,6-dehydratase [Alphaproteobacteria bacterium]|nr:CDP-glucose 4,6-dehydratase [Alphaproteobacteria bacterium]